MDFSASDRAAYEKLPDDVPFELPKGWVCCRLGEIAEVQLGKMLDRKKTNGTPLPYLANVSVRWGEFDLLALKTMPFSECEKEKFALRPGDILMCEGGVPGRCAIWREPDSIIKYQKALHRIRLKTVSAEYIRYFFEAIHDTMFFTKRFSGSTIHHLPREVLIQVPIPLPPLTEQKRIVASIEELFKIADRLGEAADGLETAAKHLDKKILDLAIRGKLLPQNPEDEPASELLKRIAATSHKSPCKNHETPIEPPFKIPESWVWTRLGTICEFYLGKTPPRANKLYWAPPAVPWVTISDMTQYGRIVRTREGVSSYAIANGAIGKISPAGTLLMSFKLTIGKVSILDCDATHNEAIISILPCCNPSNIMRDYLFATLPCLVGNAETSPAIMGDTLNKKTLSNLLIPLPPLAEQKRIVSKVGELKSLFQALATS